jgi:hypothetical protein
MYTPHIVQVIIMYYPSVFQKKKKNILFNFEKRHCFLETNHLKPVGVNIGEHQLLKTVVFSSKMLRYSTSRCSISMPAMEQIRNIIFNKNRSLGDQDSCLCVATDDLLSESL